MSGKTISYVYSMAKAKTSIKFHMNLDFLKNFQDLYGMFVVLTILRIFSNISGLNRID